MSRTVCWFSAGAASAVATKITLAADPDALVVALDTGSEHEDNDRFRDDCAAWFEREITVLRSETYQDTWDVWQQTRYLVGPTGARCTAELKKKPRYAFEKPDDVHVFGFTADRREIKRAERFREQNPGLAVSTPLIEHNVTKQDCLAVLAAVGIAIPAMYLLGYQNNNCVGCVKGGMGYWNKIRVDFPEVFDRMAKVEREIGVSILRSKGERVFLDELDPNRGNALTEPDFECSTSCEMTIDLIGGSPDD